MTHSIRILSTIYLHAIIDAHIVGQITRSKPIEPSMKWTFCIEAYKSNKKGINEKRRWFYDYWPVPIDMGGKMAISGTFDYMLIGQCYQLKQQFS